MDNTYSSNRSYADKLDGLDFALLWGTYEGGSGWFGIGKDRDVEISQVRFLSKSDWLCLV